ncbi:PREDICTED: U3 small nucleolar ribonucleoprotein protein IMP4-like [Amphimedon queenslandica]|nr:PREDICTED: U3 small nucleolar ribonucleoprotein protein IMP4-like [Amphimedon queenslandica]|eukprot:XP_003386630.1 PREDICTED: U3 small nucleolar ribonucleoprotein protein IMP4-like [Amphimedon queenslandica]
MLRRQARLRREYLYRKGLEEKQRAIHERKEKLKKAIDEGRRIPTEIRKETEQLRHSIQFDDEERLGLTTHEDDEYAWAGVEDPNVVITTSHNPSSSLKQFVKELRLVIPNSQRINRGQFVIGKLVEACNANGATDLIIVHEHRGVPDSLIVCHLPYGPTATFTIFNTVMRHDIPNIGTMSEAYPHLIFHNFKTKLGERVTNILKYLFPVPKEDSKRVITFANSEDYISFRHHVYKRDGKEIQLKEVGPRFELKLFKISLGTIDQKDVDVEWKLRPYLNTAKKKLALSHSETS